MIQPSNASFDSDTLIKWVHEHELELVWWGCASQVISPYLRIFCLGCLFVALRGVLMIREEQIPLKDELHQQKTSIHNMASVCMRLKKLNSALSALSVKASPNWCKLMIECTHEGDTYKRFCYNIEDSLEGKTEKLQHLWAGGFCYVLPPLLSWH